MITAQYATNRFTKYTTIAVPKERCLSSAVSIIFRTHFASKNLLQSVSLPFSEIDKMQNQIDIWEKESISEKGMLPKILKPNFRNEGEARQIGFHLSRLGDIEREIYLQRKDLLLRQKAKFEESFKDFGQQRKIRSNPCGVSFVFERSRYFGKRRKLFSGKLFSKNRLEPYSQRQNAFMQLGGALGIHRFPPCRREGF